MLRFPSGGQMRLYGGGRRVLWLMGEEEYAFSDQLPEDTALRRNMKAFLLAGGRPGWAARRLREG